MRREVREAKLQSACTPQYIGTAKIELTDLPTRLCPQSSTTPTPSHGFIRPVTPKAPNPCHPTDLTFSSLRPLIPSWTGAAVSRRARSIRSVSSYSGMEGNRASKVSRGVNIRFSVVLIPAVSRRCQASLGDVRDAENLPRMGMSVRAHSGSRVDALFRSILNSPYYLLISIECRGLLGYNEE